MKTKISKMRRWIVTVLLYFFLFYHISCRKLVEIPPPVNSITTSQVFSDSSDVAAAVLGIYSNIEYLNGGSFSFCNGAQTILCGLSSDELVPYNVSGDQFYLNELSPISGIVSSHFWNPAYTHIYHINACIEGLERANSVSSAIKNHYLGEAKFLRALLYFYMINLFGDVPYITSTDWAKTSLSSRTPKSEAYQQIISDLRDAQEFLPSDYSYSGGQKTRANRWAATALLARVYLYTEDWTNAAMEANSIIENSGLFTLSADLDNVFTCNSEEAILQWQMDTNYPTYSATAEGAEILPAFENVPPQYYISEQLLASFEPKDRRRTSWLDSINAGGIAYFAPYKYKIGVREAVPGGRATEYCTVLRLAEQYLIRAEARANGAPGGLSAAIQDLNFIRSRSMLADYSGPIDKIAVLNSIYHERQIELFVEWGHRWLDLKRIGKVDSVMNVATPKKIGGHKWNRYQQLYPIPQTERNFNPNLTQNAGY